MSTKTKKARQRGGKTLPSIASICKETGYDLRSLFPYLAGQAVQSVDLAEKLGKALGLKPSNFLIEIKRLRHHVLELFSAEINLSVGTMWGVLRGSRRMALKAALRMQTLTGITHLAWMSDELHPDNWLTAFVRSHTLSGQRAAASDAAKQKLRAEPDGGE